ncbi:mfs transporter : Major facilitator superfamily MFS_1 OS=Chthoniobacter flavus Ellin428 GN=CfE428DRAFT_5032 PE=4 SV=1: MFS_1 [Gemmataceae bacterium]|nr:mfs transporter : Major facilitator superfamily MFS_1 OS=Chthoniobacter flavus Ellin428 GN=CfE428DRAFT_5032 PE=4 SV=1: MFS_1 [Gemmataceae bacterium]VTU00101.1 mfs transporter : Major facilitator superfamily MFS_1 OS=Chthoniobacter flavus Ellin428 GN=CfE428DRAFT_5032 PE=4 SV=1: MFS_1 [Gemmataceae bacterium]
MSLAPPTPGLRPVTRWLVLLVAAIGFLFDTYELLMFPVIGAQALSELLKVPPTDDLVRLWAGRMLWIAALAGGLFGLLGGFLIDRLGRKTVMIGSILVYSLSPVAAAYSTELWHLVLFRCTTFIGVCVELIAAVTWLAELFQDKRQREIAIGWTLACASLGGILVTEVFNEIVGYVREHPEGISWLPVPTAAAWRYTLLTGLVPGGLILLLMPFVPESRVWKAKKEAGTLKRPRLGELFSPELRRTTIVTTLLSACGYAAAFGALQLTPLQMAPGLPALNEVKKEVGPQVKAAEKKLEAAATPDDKKAAGKELAAARKPLSDAIEAKRGNLQRWQELGGLTGRILFAIMLLYVASRVLIRIFLLPGVVLFPVAYLVLYQGDYTVFAIAIFFCGLLTVAQFSYVSEYLPKVFPVHLRGTGSGFATNVGGRMLGTMAATLNTEILAPMFTGVDGNPQKVAHAAAIIGGAVYAVALVLSFLLPPALAEEHDAPKA